MGDCSEYPLHWVHGNLLLRWMHYVPQVGLRSLNLGICPKLSMLVIEAPEMDLLELKGCGVLSEASINCPRLTSLDASFCR